MEEKENTTKDMTFLPPDLEIKAIVLDKLKDKFCSDDVSDDSDICCQEFYVSKELFDSCKDHVDFLYSSLDKYLKSILEISTKILSVDVYEKFDSAYSILIKFVAQKKGLKNGIKN